MEKGELNGDEKYLLGNCINFSIPGVDAEAFMLMTKDLISISNGSACTSSNYEPSHVIKSMTNNEDKLRGALRFSWCHLTDSKIPVEEIESRIHEVLKFISKEQLIAAPDCGLGHLSRELAMKKLKIMSVAAKKFY